VNLLSSVCGYQQTRRAWKKEVQDAFFHTNFFLSLDNNKEDPHLVLKDNPVSKWKVVIDHLMTHDNTTFKDLIGRIGVIRSTTGPSSLNLFSNKDQEHELRANMLKRMAFVLFSSEVNQFKSALPEIQERLADSLKLQHVPNVQQQVFLCFRVLLIKILPTSLAALWPTMLTELYQILVRIEAEIEKLPTPKVKSQETSNAKLTRDKIVNASQLNNDVIITPLPSSSNSNKNNKEKDILALYLSVCKLLDLLLVIQPDQIPHFKLFMWSFVGKISKSTEFDDSMANDVIKNSTHLNMTTQKPNFTPLCKRIQNTLAEKNPSGADQLNEVVPNRPQLAMRTISSILELQTFFNTISSSKTVVKYHQHDKLHNSVISKKKDVSVSKKKASMENLSDVLTLLEKDFAENVSS